MNRPTCATCRHWGDAPRPEWPNTRLCNRAMAQTSFRILYGSGDWCRCHEPVDEKEQADA